MDPVSFLPEITLTKHEVLDLVADADAIVSRAEELGAMEIAVAADGIRRLLLGRLMGVEEE